MTRLRLFRNLPGAEASGMGDNDLFKALNELLDKAVADLLSAREAAFFRPTAVEWTTGYCKGVAAAIAVIRNMATDEIFDLALSERVEPIAV